MERALCLDEEKQFRSELPFLGVQTLLMSGSSSSSVCVPGAGASIFTVLELASTERLSISSSSSPEKSRPCLFGGAVQEEDKETN